MQSGSGPACLPVVREQDIFQVQGIFTEYSQCYSGMSPLHKMQSDYTTNRSELSPGPTYTSLENYLHAHLPKFSHITSQYNGKKAGKIPKITKTTKQKHHTLVTDQHRTPKTLNQAIDIHTSQAAI